MFDLVIFENCPFCHRCQLVLLEKGAAFRTVQIEPSEKQDSKQLLSQYVRARLFSGTTDDRSTKQHHQ